MRALVASTAGLLLAAAAARADGPGPDHDGWAGSQELGPGFADDRTGRRGSGWPRPARRVTGGPGYVGSEWGLGKPSFYGIGPRPDWGRSSID